MLMTLFAPLFLATSALPQDDALFLDSKVLTIGKESWTARQVLHKNTWGDPHLERMLDRDSAQAALYINSPVFLTQVRAFADAHGVDKAIPHQPTEEELRMEADSWAHDRGLRVPAKGILLNHGPTISTRVKLLSVQESELGTQTLRHHLYQSVPEFFGELSLAWIREPLFDPITGRVLSPAQRETLYHAFDKAAQQIQNQELSWEDAVEALSPHSKEKDHGRLGFVRRTMTNRFEEGFLRPVFANLGFVRQEGAILRGPILTERWIYLANIEATRIRGVVDLEQVRARVHRSLREENLQKQLEAFRTDFPAIIHLPLS